MNLVNINVRSFKVGAHKIKLPTQKDKWLALEIIAKIWGALNKFINLIEITYVTYDEILACSKTD
jgi:hypothetical protein